MIPISFDLYSFYSLSLYCYSTTACGNEWSGRVKMPWRCESSDTVGMNLLPNPPQRHHSLDAEGLLPAKRKGRSGRGHSVTTLI
jgi:hypothetical protein